VCGILSPRALAAACPAEQSSLARDPRRLGSLGGIERRRAPPPCGRGPLPEDRYAAWSFARRERLVENYAASRLQARILAGEPV
jgi:hypothetical protein